MENIKFYKIFVWNILKKYTLRSSNFIQIKNDSIPQIFKHKHFCIQIQKLSEKKQE